MNDDPTQISADQPTSPAESSTRKTPAISPIPDLVIESEIGRGGMGVVLRARQTYLDRTVALKLLLTSGGDLEQEFLRRFQREAKILATLQHPNIVACYQAGLTAHEQPYLVMEFIDGPNLRHHLRDHGPLTVPQAVALVHDLALALEHAHGHGIIHRDVKPENALLAPPPAGAGAAADPLRPWVVKLVDLGLARPQQGHQGDMALTREGVVVGTPSTMAPEQFDDPDHVDFRADIYGLGCILYQSLTGQPAFDGKTIAQVVSAKITQAVPRPSSRRQGLAPEVDALVERMLAPSRDQRHASYRELIRDCERVLLTTSQTAEGRRPTGSRMPWLLSAAGLAAVVLVGVALIRPGATAGSAVAPGGAAPVSVPVAVPASGATPPTTTPTPPVASVRDVARLDVATAKALPWAAVQPLFQPGIGRRLDGWTPSAGAVWVAAEEIDDVHRAVTGRSGRISRPIERFPCRIEGTWRMQLARAGAAEETDVARVGLVLANGERIALCLTNLGSRIMATVDQFDAQDEFRTSSQGPDQMELTADQGFSLVVNESSVLAAAGGLGYSQAIALRSPPVEVFFGSYSKAPTGAPVHLLDAGIRYLKAP